ncbi:MAG TPA: DNA mismatch repair endonuclease MutL [Gemmatimonadaceae bacterium]|nr:DNA mismatch repair endonuclease MutL [Gemmatimonadaceae bacterium]
MPRITVLPSAVADQIAAGEVVERPASIVKELIENALDAGATTIDVELEDGGRALVRVSDDGSGMDREDAVLALERHATSKIRSAQDLVGVASFGFRGEALPAICSVARVEIVTAVSDGAATVVRAAGGQIERIEEGARRRGTTVSVGHVFFNTPARRKFLRGVRSELRAASDAVTAVALVRRDLRLRLTADGREILMLTPARTLRDRIAALWGADYAARFVEVDAVRGPVRVSGVAERPADVGTASRRVAVIVNGRAIRDTGVIRAAEAAYRTTLATGLRPALFLQIDMPGDAVDVNVHPAKAEVRFHDRWNLERAVEHAVRRALGVLESAAVFGSGARVWSPPVPAAPESLAMLPASVVRPFFGENAPPSGATDGNGGRDAATSAALPALVQLRRTYLLYEHDEGVVLIDQHSAHERVLYERFLQELSGGGAPSQRLLIPETLHLSPDDAEALEAHREELTRLGYELEAFGGHSAIVHAVPLPHPRFDALRCLRETLATLSGDRAPAAHARHERLVATMACKAAVKAGDALSQEEMHALLRALASTELPAHDVHGRTGIMLLGWDELDRRFGRR